MARRDRNRLADGRINYSALCITMACAPVSAGRPSRIAVVGNIAFSSLAEFVWCSWRERRLGRWSISNIVIGDTWIRFILSHCVRNTHGLSIETYIRSHDQLRPRPRHRPPDPCLSTRHDRRWPLQRDWSPGALLISALDLREFPRLREAIHSRHCTGQHAHKNEGTGSIIGLWHIRQKRVHAGDFHLILGAVASFPPISFACSHC